MANESLLTEDQKAKIVTLYSKSPDLITITKEVFNDETLDGRSKEGRAVREFLSERGLQYKTTKTVSRDDVVLSDRDKDFILQHCKNMTAFEIAKMLFPEEEIVSALSKHCRVVIDYIREYEPDELKPSESAVGVSYRPPESLTEAVAIINKETIQELIPTKLSTQDRQSIKAFLRFIGSPRVIQIINSYSDQTDRDLFQSEFTRFTWDKQDLSADDIALYIGVCQDIVTNKRLVRHMDQLNTAFEDASDNNELTMRLSDTIKTKSEEYDKVQKRVGDTLKKLSGDRAARMLKRGLNTANFLAIVEAFQIEEERKRFLMVAKGMREKNKKEIDRLESLDELKARILGISKEEAI